MSAERSPVAGKFLLAALEVQPLVYERFAHLRREADHRPGGRSNNVLALPGSLAVSDAGYRQAMDQVAEAVHLADS